MPAPPLVPGVPDPDVEGEWDGESSGEGPAPTGETDGDAGGVASREGLGSGVGEAAGEGSGDAVGVGVGRGVAVAAGVGVTVGVGSGDGPGVAVGFGVGAGVGFGVGAGVGAAVGVGVGVGVGDGEGVGGGGVGVGDGEGAGEGEGVGVGVGEGDGGPPVTFIVRSNNCEKSPPPQSRRLWAWASQVNEPADAAVTRTLKLTSSLRPPPSSRDALVAAATRTTVPEFVAVQLLPEGAARMVTLAIENSAGMSMWTQPSMSPLPPPPVFFAVIVTSVGVPAGMLAGAWVRVHCWFASTADGASARSAARPRAAAIDACRTAGRRPCIRRPGAPESRASTAAPVRRARVRRRPSRCRR